MKHKKLQKYSIDDVLIVPQDASFDDQIDIFIVSWNVIRSENSKSSFENEHKAIYSEKNLELQNNPSYLKIFYKCILCSLEIISPSSECCKNVQSKFPGEWSS